jgi:hypothetical protein
MSYGVAVPASIFFIKSATSELAFLAGAATAGVPLKLKL